MIWPKSVLVLATILVPVSWEVRGFTSARDITCSLRLFLRVGWALHMLDGCVRKVRGLIGVDGGDRCG